MKKHETVAIDQRHDKGYHCVGCTALERRTAALEECIEHLKKSFKKLHSPTQQSRSHQTSLWESFKKKADSNLPTPKVKCDLEDTKPENAKTNRKDVAEDEILEPMQGSKRKKRGADRCVTDATAGVANRPESSGHVVEATKVFEPVMDVASPLNEKHCYRVLNVSRTASDKDIRKAFRKLAILLHPDKPTGDKKAFVCLNEAFEVISDPLRRGAYDSDLASTGSRDGLSFDVDLPDQHVPGPSLRSPEVAEMVSDLLLKCSQDKWDKLFEVISAETLAGLIDYLRSPATQAKKDIDVDTAVSKGSSTVGISRKGKKYYGNVRFEGVDIWAYPTKDLSVAIDGRIALVQLKNKVKELTSKSVDFGRAVAMAVYDIRASEQASCFWMQFRNDLKSPKSGRFWSPFRFDVEKAIDDRQTFIELQANGASVLALVAAKNAMFADRKKQSKEISARRSANIGILLMRALNEQARRNDPTRLKRFRSISPCKIGVLETPALDASVIAHVQSGEIFEVRAAKVNYADGRRY